MYKYRTCIDLKNQSIELPLFSDFTGETENKSNLKFLFNKIFPSVNKT
jgi:hypothetical protein